MNAATNDKDPIRKTALGLIEEFMGKGKFRLLGVGVTKLEKLDERQTYLSDFL